MIRISLTAKSGSMVQNLGNQRGLTECNKSIRNHALPFVKDDYEFSGEVALLANDANKNIEVIQCKQLAELKQPLINKSDEREDDEFISQFTEAIYHRIRDVTAANFGDLMKEISLNFLVR